MTSFAIFVLIYSTAVLVFSAYVLVKAGRK